MDRPIEVEFEFADDSGEVNTVGVHLVDAVTREHLVCWTGEEWKEDPEILPAIFNAIKLAYTDPDAIYLVAGWKKDKTAEGIVAGWTRAF